MLTFDNITLLSIDTVDPNRSIRAMRYSLLQAKFAEAVLVTTHHSFRPEMLRTIGGKGRIDQIRVDFVQPGPRSDYERQIICDLPKWFNTDFVLFQEWDSAIMNPAAWSQSWLNYDFIGAPWPYDFHENGYPTCTKDNCVGNGGFSLRSRFFAQSTGDLLRNSGSVKEALRLSDAWICRTIRPKLESEMGLRFAPEEEAAKFSCENRFYSGQFGIHGKNTIAMNGWKWDFEWLR